MNSSESFQKELRDLINRHSMENGSDTPDFILAEYLRACLKAWNNATTAREKWYGREIRAKSKSEEIEAEKKAVEYQLNKLRRPKL